MTAAGRGRRDSWNPDPASPVLAWAPTPTRGRNNAAVAWKLWKKNSVDA